MKVLVFLVCLKLVNSASIRSQDAAVDEEVASPVVDEHESHDSHGHDQPGHSHEDHHRDESGHDKAGEPEVVVDKATDGTGKYSVPVKPRLDRAYDAIHVRERRSPSDQIPLEQVSLNCREVVAVGVRDPYTCARLGQGALPGDASSYGVAIDAMGQIIGSDGKVIFSDPTGSFSTGPGLDLAKAPGRCRYDANKALVNPSTACLCAATSATCTQNREGCYWFVDKKSGNKECISNAERFYDLLYMLLHKRGKKDFAINIRYGGTPARGSLPLGPMGPMIIGQGNPSPTYVMNADGTASPAPVDPAAGLPFSYGTPLAGLPPNAGLPVNPTGYDAQAANQLGYGGVLANPMGYGGPAANPFGYGMTPPILDPSGYGGLGMSPMLGMMGRGGGPAYGLPQPSSSY